MIIRDGSEKLKENNICVFPTSFIVLSSLTSLQTIHYSSCKEKNLFPNFMLEIFSTFCSALYTNIALCMLGFQAFFSNILATIPSDRPLVWYKQKVLWSFERHFCGYNTIVESEKQNLLQKPFLCSCNIFARENKGIWKYLTTMSMRLSRIRWYGGTLLFISIQHR